ncbi:UNVERIFIED_CONTAM: hypothetical protein GTU68_004870 [Idotea baltica]|nr:hypothetical protein [Idotea baltica]
MADTVAAHMTLKLENKQLLLEMYDINERIEKLMVFLESEIDIQHIEKRIRSRVKKQMEKSQREYYLNEQMKAVQKELGEYDDSANEIEELADRIAKAAMPAEAKTKAESELKKLKMMSAMSAEATVVRNYIEWLTDLPWKKRSRISHDLDKAEKVLNQDHHGLEKVKERILEYLAVQQRVKKAKGPILCLVGPPGVGKTSVAESIARATNRKYSRMALGGVRDEAEIRGHRRTYIGSMPGKIIQNIAKTGVKNPLFLLDEIDKMAQDFRGDPASALLEVLDPEQNAHFADHYMEVNYDLSDVMFVCTANTLNIPDALRDRMEIIHLSGYTEDEKFNIAVKYLLPKALKENGLKTTEVTVEDDALLEVIRRYTREAGVRHLQREISKIFRKVVKEILQNKKVKVVTITKAEGATPKDGPSAGIGMCTALVSAVTGIPVKANVAMTGEITLRGEVLPIGGLKEKLLAALRGGIDTVLIPKDNVKDLKDIPDNIKQGLTIIPVHWISEVLEHALLTVPKPIEGKAGSEALLTNEQTRYHGVGSENRH